MALVLDEQTSAGADSVFAEKVSKHCENPQIPILNFQLDFRIGIVGSQRNRIAVTVVNNGVILPDSSEDTGTGILVNGDQRTEMFPFFPEYLSGNFLGELIIYRRYPGGGLS